MHLETAIEMEVSVERALYAICEINKGYQDARKSIHALVEMLQENDEPNRRKDVVHFLTLLDAEQLKSMGTAKEILEGCRRHALGMEIQVKDVKVTNTRQKKVFTALANEVIDNTPGIKKWHSLRSAYEEMGVSIDPLDPECVNDYARDIGRHDLDRVASALMAYRVLRSREFSKKRSDLTLGVDAAVVRKDAT